MDFFKMFFIITPFCRLCDNKNLAERNTLYMYILFFLSFFFNFYVFF